MHRVTARYFLLVAAFCALSVSSAVAADDLAALRAKAVGYIDPHPNLDPVGMLGIRHQVPWHARAPDAAISRGVCCPRALCGRTSL